MAKFRLNTNEMEYINRAGFIKEIVKYELLNNLNKFEDHFEVQISDDQIVALEEIFSEQLQKVGFDINYEPTEEGKLLENLLDKLSDLE